MDDVGITFRLQGPRRWFAVRHGVADQAQQVKVGAGIAELGFGAQHKHGQAFEGLCQQVTAEHEQNVVMRALETNKAGLHAAFGRAKSGQACVVQIKQREVIGQLAVQEAGSVIALYADDAQM